MSPPISHEPHSSYGSFHFSSFEQLLSPQKTMCDRYPFERFLRQETFSPVVCWTKKNVSSVSTYEMIPSYGEPQTISRNARIIHTHLTIILPGFATNPGQTLIPKRRPAESRPLFDDPPAFLVAFRTVMCLCASMVRNVGETREAIRNMVQCRESK